MNTADLLAQENDALRAEVERLKAERNAYRKDADRLGHQVAALIPRIAALEDAKRKWEADELVLAAELDELRAALREAPMPLLELPDGDYPRDPPYDEWFHGTRARALGEDKP